MFGLKKLVQSILDNVKIQARESVNQTEHLSKIYAHSKHQSDVLDQLLKTQLAMAALQKKTFRNEETKPETEEEMEEYEAQQEEHQKGIDATNEMYFDDISLSAEGK